MTLPEDDASRQFRRPLTTAASSGFTAVSQVFSLAREMCTRETIQYFAPCFIILGFSILALLLTLISFFDIVFLEGDNVVLIVLILVFLFILIIVVLVYFSANLLLYAGAKDLKEKMLRNLE